MKSLLDYRQQYRTANVVNKINITGRRWTESTSASAAPPPEGGGVVVVVVVGIVALAKPILALVPPPAVKTVVIGLFPLKNEVTAAPGLTLIPVYHMFKFPPFSTTDGKATRNYPNHHLRLC